MLGGKDLTGSLRLMRQIMGELDANLPASCPFLEQDQIRAHGYKLAVGNTRLSSPMAGCPKEIKTMAQIRRQWRSQRPIGLGRALLLQKEEASTLWRGKGTTYRAGYGRVSSYVMNSRGRSFRAYWTDPKVDVGVIGTTAHSSGPGFLQCVAFIYWE